MIVKGRSFSTENDDVAEEFSKHFKQVINNLDLYKFSSCPMVNSIDEIDYLVSKSNLIPVF